MEPTVNPKVDSPRTISEYSTTPEDRLFGRINHLLRNKLQAISGGQYLLEAGIKKNDCPLVGSSWEIVKRNQADLIRCSHHLLVLHRLENLEPDPIQFEEILHSAKVESEALFGQCNILVTCEKAQPPVLIDPFVIRSTLIGLIRVASFSELEPLESVDITIEHQDRLMFKILFPCEASIEEVIDGTPSVSIEWRMAEKVVSRLGGTIRLNQAEKVCCISGELPSKCS